MDLTPEAEDKLPHVNDDPLVEINSSVCPDGLGKRYAEDPETLPVISMSCTLRVPLAVIPPLEKVNPPMPPRSLIAPKFNCAIFCRLL